MPSGELAEFCCSQVDMGMGVTAADVADHFDVTEAVAARAVRLWISR